MKRSTGRVLGSAFCLTQVLAAQDIQSIMEFRVKLLRPLSKETNRKGDKLAGQILSPDVFAGSMMEGEVRESKSGSKLKGTSVLTFTFKSIQKDSQAIRCGRSLSPS